MFLELVYVFWAKDIVRVSQKLTKNNERDVPTFAITLLTPNLWVVIWETFPETSIKN